MQLWVLLQMWSLTRDCIVYDFMGWPSQTPCRRQHWCIFIYKARLGKLSELQQSPATLLQMVAFWCAQGFDRSGGNRIVLLHTVDVETTFANRSKMNMFISTIKSSSISSVVKEHRLWTQLRHITRWFMKCCLEAFTWAFPQSLSLCLKSDVISKSSDLTVYLHLHWLMPKPWIIPFSKRINKIVLSFI